jgi:PTH1 family peptidyl-tRNA hydrolase
MKLIVGLGNPGSQYQLTRHNIGFLAVDVFAKSLQQESWKEEHKALTCRLTIENEQVLLAKPQTYMNLSGESVVSMMNFYKIPLENLIVAHDDLDIPFKSLRIQRNRGHAGHNGIRSISEKLGTMDYIRLKLGIGRPPHPEMKVADFVLQKFSSEEMQGLNDFLNRAGDAMEAILFEGVQKAANHYNKDA